MADIKLYDLEPKSDEQSLNSENLIQDIDTEETADIQGGFARPVARPLAFARPVDSLSLDLAFARPVDSLSPDV